MSAFDPIADISELSQSEHVTPEETGENRVEGIGCAWALLGVNTVLMGLLAASFVQGPYSSSEQSCGIDTALLASFWQRRLCPQSLCLVPVAHAGLSLLPRHGCS
jgi:hypothetical protein